MVKKQYSSAVSSKSVATKRPVKRNGTTTTSVTPAPQSSAAMVSAPVVVDVPRSSSRATPPASPPPAPRHEDIAHRAYEIWLAKGRPHGQDHQNWTEAERDLRQRPAPR